jgi:two-component system cell cycle response regulator
MMRSSDLERALERLETEHYTSVGGQVARAQDVLRRALDVHDRSAVLRARLMVAHLGARTGDMGSGLEVYREVLRAAEADGDWTAVARAHALTGFDLDHLGLRGHAFGQVQQAIDLLPLDAPVHLQAEHRMLLAYITSQDGGATAFGPLFDDALRLARESGQSHLVLAVMNNYAWTLYGHGRFEEAAVWCRALQVDAADFGLPLSINALDTIACVLIEHGALDEAELVLREALEDRTSDEDALSRPQALVTASRLHQLRGDLEAAQSAAREACALSRARDMRHLEAMAVNRLADVQAACGDFAGAYASMRSWEHLWGQVRSRENDAQASAIQVVLATQDAHRRSARFEQMADTDALTGLCNRRYVDRVLGRQLLDLDGTDAVALVLVDVDHFKAVNDTTSHHTGDQVLIALSELLQAHLADQDGQAFAGRLGGDEFVAVLPGRDCSAAEVWAHALADDVRAHDWSTVGWAHPVTLSIGIAAVSLPTTASELLRAADGSLYETKRAGRDGVQVAGRSPSGCARVSRG